MVYLSSSPFPARRKSLVLAVAAALAFGLASEAATALEVGPAATPPTFTVDELDVSDVGDAVPLAAAPDPKQAQTLYLEVLFGDRTTGQILQLQWRDGRLFAAASDLEAIGIVVDPALPRDGQGRLALDSLPGLQYRYDAAQQQLILSVPVSLRPKQTLGYHLPSAVRATRSRGLLLGYDAYANSSGGTHQLSVASQVRWFGRFGALEQTGISRAGTDSRAYRRLDSRWTYSDSTTMATWTLGDLITGGPSWSRPVRLGGLQWRRNFGLRPDLITYPIPQISGQATVPSTVDLLVNNIQQYGGAVDDGPFVVDAFPRISGAGEVTVVVRDALGRVTQTSVPIYVDYQRLAPGLTDFSVEAGRLRLNYASDQDHYGRDLAASASLRRGITRTLTVEAHAEHAPGLRLAGFGAVWSPLGRWGLVSAAIARSDAGDSASRGSQRSIGYQWSGSHGGFDALSIRRDAGFRDLGDIAVPGASAAAMRSQDRATFWMPVPHGNLSLNWLHQTYADGTSDRINTVSWSQLLADRVYLNASLFDSQRGGRGVGITASLPLGPRRDASLTVRHDSGRTETVAGVRQSPDYDGGWGWNLQAGDRSGGYGNAMAEFRGRYGAAMAGVEHTGGATNVYAQGSGSLVLMAGHAFPSRRIADSFAVVSTGGAPNVPVLYENRPLGKTDRRGFLLLPDLRGWQRNKISINPDGLAANFRLPPVDQWVVPADQSGVLVPFPVVAIHPAWATLLDESGAPVGAGTSGRIAGTEQRFLVGLDGEAYFDDVAPGAVLELDTRAGHCRYRLPATPVGPGAGVRQLGVLACEVMP